MTRRHRFVTVHIPQASTLTLPVHERSARTQRKRLAAPTTRLPKPAPPKTGQASAS